MKNMEIYRCSRCAMQCEITMSGNAQEAPLCCGIPMELQNANTVDASKEKHVPVIEQGKDGIMVKVGSAEHPMTEAHYIEWIEVIYGSRSERCYLKPADLPQAFFSVPASPNLTVRISCNIHGVWQNK